MDSRKFKIVRTSDYELIKKIHRDLFPVDDIIKNKDTSIFWLIKFGNKIAGFCAASEYTSEIFYLERAGIYEKYRGNNLQIRLIRTREKYARKYNFKKIITYTKIYNINSARNLQKAGYELYIPEKEYADKDCNYWIKHLDKKKK